MTTVGLALAAAYIRRFSGGHARGDTHVRQRAEHPRRSQGGEPLAGRTANYNVAGRCRSYPILMYEVLEHLGQGGSLSSVLSKRTVSPQARHL